MNVLNEHDCVSVTNKEIKIFASNMSYEQAISNWMVSF